MLLVSRAIDFCNFVSVQFLTFVFCTHGFSVCKRWQQDGAARSESRKRFFTIDA